jgi:hypothetical protein
MPERVSSEFSGAHALSFVVNVDRKWTSSQIQCPTTLPRHNIADRSNFIYKNISCRSLLLFIGINSRAGPGIFNTNVRSHPLQNLFLIWDLAALDQQKFHRIFSKISVEISHRQRRSKKHASKNRSSLTSVRKVVAVLRTSDTLSIFSPPSMCLRPRKGTLR